MDFYSNILFYLFLFVVALVTTVVFINRKNVKHKRSQHQEPTIHDDLSLPATDNFQESAEYSPPTTPEDVIVLRVVALEDAQFLGYDLLQTLLHNGFRHGAMNIFHRHQHDNGRGAVLFSLASATEPGTFELNQMGNLSYKGLTLFLRMNTLTDPLAAFNIMLDTAANLAEDLKGALVDDQGETITERKVTSLTQQIKKRLSTTPTPDLFAYENR